MNSEYTTDPRKQCIHNPLWIVLGAGMAFAAWALVALIPSYQRSACIHRIWKLGGYVQTASKLPPFEHRFPGVAHGWLGSKVERAVRLVRLAGTEAEDADLKALCRLSTQRALDLRDTQVTDTGLRYLQALRELRVLILTGTSVRDEGVLQLGPLKQLEVLCLEETGVTDRAISQLKQLPNLEWLNLSGTAVTDAGLVELATCDSLKVLVLEDCATTSSAVERLRQSSPQLLVFTGNTRRPFLSLLSAY